MAKFNSALVALLATRAFTQAADHVITPSDIANIHKVSDTQISPDGQSVAYVIETPVKAGEQRDAHIWLTSAPDHPFISSAKSDTSPRWAPDGKVLAFLSDRVGKDKQLWAIALKGGEAYRLTELPGGVKSFKWSRDGKMIGFVRTDPETPEEKARKERKDDHILVDRDYKFDRLWVLDIGSGKARQVTEGPLNIDDFDWSPDDKQVVARISPTPVLNDYWYVSKVVLLDLQSGRVSKTLTEKAAPEPVLWAATGDRVLYGETTPRQIASFPVLHSLTTGKKTQIGNGLKASLRAFAWDAHGTNLMAQGVEGTRTFFAHVDPETGQVGKRTDVPAEGYTFTESDDGKTLAYLGQSANRPDDVWIYSDEGGPKSLANANPQVADWKTGQVREVSWKSSKDGKLIYGVLILPPDFQPGTPRKTIVHAHGGPFEAWQSGWLGTWYEWSQLLASNGFVVLAPNPRGSQGQGPEFQEDNFEDWGGGDYQDVMDGVDMLVKQKIADPAHLGIGGWSYGGFMTSWTITHTNRFQAAVVGAAVTDLYGMSTTTDIAPNFLTEFFGNFIANRKLYDAHSPIRFVENCHTPTLVLHGDADLRVPTFQGEEFYNALRLLGRPAEFVRYPREPHIFAEREHQIDMLQRLLTFFSSHL